MLKIDIINNLIDNIGKRNSWAICSLAKLYKTFLHPIHLVWS